MLTWIVATSTCEYLSNTDLDACRPLAEACRDRQTLVFQFPPFPTQRLSGLGLGGGSPSGLHGLRPHIGCVRISRMALFGRAGPRLEGRLVLTAQREGSLSHTEVSTHTGIHIPKLQAHHSQSAMSLSTSFPLFTLLLMSNFNFSLLLVCPKSLFRTASQPRRDLHRTSEPRPSLHSHHFATQSNCSCMPSTFFHSLASRLFWCSPPGACHLGRGGGAQYLYGEARNRPRVTVAGGPGVHWVWSGTPDPCTRAPNQRLRLHDLSNSCT